MNHNSKLGCQAAAALLCLTIFITACGGGGPKEPTLLTLSPTSGPPGTVLTIAGLELSQDDAFEVWVGDEPAPARLNEDGTLSAAIPLFLGDDGWPAPPPEPQLVEVRREAAVLGRSAQGVTVTDLPRAPGSTQKVQAALSDITSAYETLLSLVPVANAKDTPIRDGVVAMLRGLISEGENSLQAVLDGTAPVLDGAEVDTELIDALLASSGALAYFQAYAEALRGAEALGAQTSSLYCRGDGEDEDLACQMQIYVVLDDYSRAFVKPTAETYANTVGLALGLVAIGGVVVPANVIIGAILSVADFIMERVAPALFPSRLTQFELQMPQTTIEVGEQTESRVLVTAANSPPPISYLDIVEQVRTIIGVKDLDSNLEKQFSEILQDTAMFVLEFYLKLVKAYEGMHPGSHPWVNAGDIRIPGMSWGPVEVQNDDLVTLFSFDETVVRPLEEELEWEGVQYGEAKVRVMPRGPGERSKVLRDHALCLGCVYSGGAFGNEMPESSVTVIVGKIELSATPRQGKAPLTTSFSWTGVEPQDEPLTCTLDAGDGSSLYTIHDCANTTTQVHAYPYTSALTESGAYEAQLAIVGTEKTARTEVMVDWSFSASPSEGEAPLDVTYSWDIPYPESGGAVRCTLDPGDNSRTYSFDDCLATTSASHRYATRGSFVAALTIANATAQDTKTAPVSVSEESSCAGVMDVTAWKGTIRYSHSRDVADVSKHVIYQVDVNVSADLTESYRTESTVGFAAEVLSGSVSLSSEDHAHGEDHRVDVTFSGSGAPAPGSRMSFYVTAGCRYGFYTIGGVAGSGTFFDDPYEGVEGFNPLKGGFDGASLSISGSYAFPVYDPDDIEASTDKPIWFAERYDVADILGRDNLGTVTVTWSFEPVD